MAGSEEARSQTRAAIHTCTNRLIHHLRRIVNVSIDLKEAAKIKANLKASIWCLVMTALQLQAEVTMAAFREATLKNIWAQTRSSSDYITYVCFVRYNKTREAFKLKFYSFFTTTNS